MKVLVYLFATVATCLLFPCGPAAFGQSLNPDGGVHQINYTGSYEEYSIPDEAGLNGKDQLTFHLTGADGGRSSYSGFDRKGGGGATVEVTFAIGTAADELRPGGKIRFIVGEHGNRGTNNKGGGGGGGTAVLYTTAPSGGITCANPSKNLADADHCWVILAVAGGGGGGVVLLYNVGDAGGNASAGECGDQGSGGAGGGCNGHGGSEGFGGGGGGGAISDAQKPGQSGGSRGGFSGGEGGSGDDNKRKGGFGYGGGGSGGGLGNGDGGGGGGGYSGGGGGSDTKGGGGGGSYANPAAVASDKQGGERDGSPDHGKVTYFFKLDNFVVAVCQDVTVQLDGDGQGQVAIADVAGDSYVIGQPSATFESMCFDPGCSKTLNVDCGDIGTQTHSVYISDTANGEDACTFQLTVEDNTPPTALCRNLTVSLSEATVSAAQFNNGSTDACTNTADLGFYFLDAETEAPLGQQLTLDCPSLGMENYVLGVFDEAGNWGSCYATLLVIDDIAPSAACRDVTVSLDEMGTVIVPLSSLLQTTSDCDLLTINAKRTECDPLCVDVIITNHINFGCDRLGVNVLTMQVSDESGNETSCIARVTVAASTAAPTINCPEDIVVNTDPEQCSAAVDFAATATNACGDHFSISYSHPPGSSFPLGTTMVTATTIGGMSASCSFELTVEDKTPPVVVCKDITFEVTMSGAFFTIYSNQVFVSASDNCDDQLTALGGATIIGCPDVGSSRSLTIRMTDDSGNTGSCTGRVTVVDVKPPQAHCKPATVQLDANGNGTLTTARVNNGSSDNCDIGGLALSRTAFGCADVDAGPIEVTLTVTDGNGNSSSCAASVTVEDKVAPTALCKNVTVQLDAQGVATISGNTVDNGSSDACGIASRVASHEAFDCGDVGNHAVTLTVTDVNGNNNSCTATVTVEDKVAPTAICKNITVQLDAQGVAVIAENAVDNGSNDACLSTLGGGLTFDTNVTSFGCVDVGNNAVTLTVTDANGNQKTCAASVTIEDKVAPTAICQNITVQLDAQGVAVIAENAVDNGSNDACLPALGGGLTFDTDVTSFGCSDVGSHPVTLTVTDANGNQKTCPASVTIEDKVAPTALCKNLTVQLDARGVAIIAENAVDNGSNDACLPTLGGGLTFDTNVTSFGCSDVGNNAVTLTVADANGNQKTCAASVKVEDKIAPSLHCTGSPIFFNGQPTRPVTDAVVVQASDACGVAGITYSSPTISCQQVGQTVVVVITATDVKGNVGRCTTSVQVNGLPCGFVDAGGIGCSSQASYQATSGTFTLQTNGCNNTSPNSDQQGFLPYQLCGNGSISFHVASLSSQNAFAGIQLRTGPETSAVKAEVVTNLYFTARGAVREYAGASAWPLPFYLTGRHWLKLERWGNQIRIYTSANGQTWSILMVRNLTLPNCVYVGMMAYGPGAVTATFDDVKVNGSPLQTGPLQTGGGGFPLEEASLKPSTVHRLPSTVLPTSDFPLPTPTLSGTGLPTVASKPSTEAPLPSPRRGETRLTLAVYPNPTSGQLTVELPAELSLDGATLEVLDAYGRSVLRETTLDYQQRLDLSRLPAGTYVVHLLTAAGDRIMERVIVGD